ncbi:MAG: hypothetical protein GY851_19375 [bacterium]|nr:hypothetical protein [bacterium]
MRRTLVVCLMAGLACSCGMLRGGTKAPEAPASAAEAPSGDNEERLQATVRGIVKAAGTDESRVDAKLVRRKPYYLKEDTVYPDGADGFEVTFRETESRTAPLVAEVTLKKYRYATVLHRKKDEAKADDTILRGSGTETLSFELRNGRWVQLGSLFVAGTTEEKVNGEWVPVQDKVDQALAAELDEREGFLGRTWSFITGR